MVLSKVKLLVNTVKHLKPVQIAYQVWYRLRPVKHLSAYSHKPPVEYCSLIFSLPPSNPKPCATQDGIFSFLNQSAKFNQIDWDFMDYGKLWNYNLHYAAWLLEEEIRVEARTAWLEQLHSKLWDDAKGLEPYPVSLRLINEIRFECSHNILNSDSLKAIHAEATFLSRRLEYHILGNHLLENAFALLMAGAFFKNHQWQNTAHAILRKELGEQILDDGGHFELSPMYHQIILFRILELIDWYRHWNDAKEEELLFYKNIATRMCGWIEQMSFSNGDIPHFNDSANHIAHTTEQLLSLAKTLNIESKIVELSLSGYWAYNTPQYECRVDIGPPGPSYQPGHAHADALSFILYAQGKPLLVEVGTSTYQTGTLRAQERATNSHNCVVINKKNQSEVWGGFRVGKRANVKVLKKGPGILEAAHDGYKSFGVLHKRSFEMEPLEIVISDNIGEGNTGIAHFHIHPDAHWSIVSDEVFINSTKFKFIAQDMELATENYNFAAGFNLHQPATKVLIRFTGSLQTRIIFK